MNIRGCCQAGQRNHDKNDAQRQRKRAEIRSRSIDEEAKERRGDCRQDEIQNRYDDPKHRSLQAAAERPRQVRTSSAAPSPETSTETRSPASGYWIGTMLPVITTMPRRSGVPAAASFPASQASAVNGLPITSRPDTAADF